VLPELKETPREEGNRERRERDKQASKQTNKQTHNHHQIETEEVNILECKLVGRKCRPAYSRDGCRETLQESETATERERERVHKDRETERETERQTDKQTERDRQDRQTHGQDKRDIKSKLWKRKESEPFALCHDKAAVFP
jgi:hypothetical protein